MCETPSILRSSSAAVVASVSRIGLAIFSLPVLLGFCSVDNRSNLYVRHSVYSYPEACHRTSFSDFHSLSVLLGRCQGNIRFGNMGMRMGNKFGGDFY